MVMTMTIVATLLPWKTTAGMFLMTSTSDFIGDSDDDDDFECDSDRTDDTATEDPVDRYTSEVNDSGDPLRTSALKLPIQDSDEFREPLREFNTLCYEDICPWVVKNPKRGGPPR